VSALAAWLKENRIKRGEFARRIGVSAPYLTQLCADPPTHWPGRDVAERIRAETAGAVTPNDFLPVHNSSEAAE